MICSLYTVLASQVPFFSSRDGDPVADEWTGLQLYIDNKHVESSKRNCVVTAPKAAEFPSASVIITKKPAKFIFSRSTPEEIPYFFTISLSQSGGKLSILDAPSHVTESLNHSLRSAFPRQIIADRATEEGVCVIELRKSSSESFDCRLIQSQFVHMFFRSAWESDKNRFSASVLGALSDFGFKLNGSIPMGKAGHLGFGSRKELWVFRATQQKRSESAQGWNRDGSVSGQRDGSAHGHGSMHGHNSMHNHDD